MTLPLESTATPLANEREMPAQFTERELQTLTLICDTLIPALPEISDDAHGFYRRCASDLDIPRLVALAIEKVAEPSVFRELRLFLASIESPLANVLLSQQGRAFGEMTLGERTRLLHSWETSSFNFRRKAFQSLKRLALALYYSVVDENQHNPNWPVFNYDIPTRSAPPATPSSIVPTPITEDTTLYTNVVIVGSGAGGGVVAGELSAAGLDVVVLEKGNYYREADFDSLELGSHERMFENRGLLTSTDLSMVILAGSTLGGGTTINWSASFRTPEDVLDEWATVYGVREFASDSYQASLDAVSKRISVNENCTENNPQNTVLETGAKKLGLAHGVIPRNVKDCTDCGFCNFGCRDGTKQGTMRTYLQDAFERGSRIIVRAFVEKILIEQGRAVGVQAKVTNEAGQEHTVTIRADVVVSAAGSLHTPGLLMRSGLGNVHIGKNLHLHPTTVTYGVYDEPVRGWSGPIMTRYVTSVRNQDGQGYGATLETAPVHPGVAALSFSWENGLQHKQTIAQLDHLANIIVLTRDFNGGRISLGKNNRPRVHYSLAPDDATHMMRGVVESIRIHEAAGATQIGAPFAVPMTWQRESDDLDEFLQAVRRQRLLPNNFALFSAHQMSSCRMAGSPTKGAVAPNGETFEVKGLYVADGSVLPTASGVNPMLTIMATAHMIAQHIKTEHPA